MSDMTASTSMSHHEAAASIVAAARTSLPDLVERVAHRIRTEIPCYAAEDVVAPADLRASVRANVDYILDSLTGRARANLSAPDATGRTRVAQGVPLAEMLTAYRVGVAELWSALVTAARGLPGVPADDVIELAGAVFAAQNTYSDAALAAYRDEAREILRTQERERAALVEVILTGAAAKGTLWEVANALRLPLDGAFLVIAAETEPGHDPIPRAESALAVIDVRSVWRLDAEVSLGVLSLPDRSRNGAVLTVLDKHATHRIGASPVFGELHQAGWACSSRGWRWAATPGTPGLRSSATARSTSWSRPRRTPPSRRRARCSAACSSCPRTSLTCCSARSRPGYGRAAPPAPPARSSSAIPTPSATGCAASRPAAAGSSPTLVMRRSSSPPSAPGANCRIPSLQNVRW